MVCLIDLLAHARKAIFAACILAVLSCSTLEAQQLVRGGVPARVVRAAAIPLTLAPKRSTSSTSGDWYPYVIAREQDRAWIREMPIEERPNRPLHFWGNSRRRLR